MMETRTIYAEALSTQVRVIQALILRDMRTRFGRTFFGYVIMVIWPLSHLLSMMAGYLVARQTAPVGTNVTVFLGTGILPYILCLYPARQIMMALFQNHPLLYFPVVKSFDVIVARVILEIITAFWVIAVFCMILFVFNIDFMPVEPGEALLAILATLYFAVALGFISAIIFKLTRAWIVVIIIAMISMYLTSGALFLPSTLTDKTQYYLSFNPLLHSVEWLRSAYYEGYSYGLLSREYLLWFSSILLAIGLVSERLLRGYILEPL